MYFYLFLDLSIFERTRISGNAVQKEAESSTQDIHKEYLDTDKTFQSGYIMIKDVPEKGIYTSKLPGEKKKKGAVSLKNGQILWASKREAMKVRRTII